MTASTTLIFLILFALIFVGLALYFWLSHEKIELETKGEFFDHEVGPIYYEVHGKKGPTVVLIHGLGASSFCWRNIIPHLSPHYRVIVFDLWGFGNSSLELRQSMGLEHQASYIDALLDHLAIKETYIVGHSMGGQIALWYALKHPNRVRKVLALAPATYPRLVSSLLKRFTWIANLTPLLVNPLFMKRSLQNLVFPSTLVNEEMVRGYFTPYSKREAHISFAAALDIVRDLRVYNHLDELSVPVTLIWGLRDRVVGTKVLNDIKEKIPQCQVITHPKVGHLPMEDNPDWLSEQILDQLSSG